MSTQTVQPKTILRPYQQKAVDETRMHAASGGTGAVIQLATGAGKTAIFCNLLMGAYGKGKHAVMVVRGKSLVHQASERLTREGVPHGIYQGANTANTHERILLCSIDTLYARRQAPHADLIVTDECHLSHSQGYDWFFAQYPASFKLGVSATPHHPKGMRHIGDKLIYPATFPELITKGFLCGGRYYVPYVPNLKGVKTVAGDFSAKELGQRVSDDTKLTGNAAKIWSDKLRGLSTLCYAASVRHAGILADALSAEGARCAIITAKTKDAERRELIARLESGDVGVLVSVGVLTTGVDIPSLRAILCCRPTKSYNLWIQILGRGTRPFPGKSHFICYDLSGNLHQHGPIEAEQIADLDDITEPKKTKLKMCAECYAVFPAVDAGAECPDCGATLPEGSRDTGGRADSMDGLTANKETVEREIRPWELDLPALTAKCREKGYKKGWIYNTLKSKYDEETANEAWPRIRALRKWPTRAQAPASTLASWRKSSD